MRTPDQEQQDDEPAAIAREVFAYWTGCRDEGAFQDSFLGRYESRAAFGEELLARLGADARLQKLPDWLRGYIRFDGDAVLRDFEAAGHFWVYEKPDVGAYVFDVHAFPVAS